jgi:ribosomal protein L7/L12
MLFKKLLNPPIAVAMSVLFLLTVASIINQQSDNFNIPPILRPISNVQTPAAAQVHSKEQREELELIAQQEMSRWAFFTMLATFSGLFITGLGVWFVKHTLDATRAAVDEAIKATEAANAAVAVTSDTAERQLRAYVTVIKARISGYAVGAYPECMITLKNTGQTPARRLRVNLSFRLLYSPASEADLAITPIDEMSQTTLGAGDEIKPRAKSPMPMLQDALDAIRLDGAAYYILGQVTYFDIFNKQQQTNFRFRFNNRSLVINDGTVEVCPDGNDGS